MAEQIKYVSYGNLSKYDEKIKDYLNTADATLKEELQGEITTVAGSVYSKTEINTKVSALESADSTLQANINTLSSTVSTNKSTIESTVSTLESKVNANETDIEDKMTALTSRVATIEGKYADKDALDEVSAVANAAVKQTDYDTKVAALEAEDARIVSLVEAEVTRATGVETGLEGRIETMEAFWNAAQADGTDSNVIDTLKEIQDYIASDETGASSMAASIKQNSDAISAMDTAYKAADATLQSNIDAKADSSVVTALDTRVGTLETASATYATKAEFNEYKDTHDSDYTNAQIDAAIKEVADDVAALGDTYATDEELATAISSEETRANGAYAAKSLENTVSGLSTTVAAKASQSDLDSVSGRVTTLETWKTNFVACEDSDIEDLFN